MKISILFLCLSLLGACSSAPEVPLAYTSAPPPECEDCTLLSDAYASILQSDFSAAELAIASASDRPLDEPHSIRAVSLSHLATGLQLLHEGDATGSAAAFSRIRDDAIQSALEAALASSPGSLVSVNQ